MKLIHYSAISCLCLFLAGEAVAQERSTSSPLRSARTTFAAADLDKDGRLDPREASRASIQSADFARYDADADRALSQDEFLLFYRALLIRSQRATGPDLDREAARILALGKARREKQARRERAERIEPDGAGARKGSDPDAPSTAGEPARAEDSLVDRTRLGDVDRSEVGRVGSELGQRARAPESGGGAEERLRGARRAMEERRRRAAEARRELEGRRDTALGSEAADLPPTLRAKVERALAALEIRAEKGEMTRERFEELKRALIERAQAQAKSEAPKEPPASGSKTTRVPGR